MQTLSSGVEHLTRATSSELTRVVKKHLLGLLRARVGEEIADSVERIASDLSSPHEQMLADQLRQIADADTLRAVIDLAGQLAATVGNFALLIDRGERLTEADMGLLMELPDLLPDGVAVVVAHRVANSQEAERVRLAASCGAQEIRVRPLDTGTIRRWALSEGLDSSQIEQLARVSDGYPIIVESAIHYARTGNDLRELPAEDSLVGSHAELVARASSRHENSGPSFIGLSRTSHS